VVLVLDLKELMVSTWRGNAGSVLVKSEQLYWISDNFRGAT
jgi:hypothetical protein